MTSALFEAMRAQYDKIASGPMAKALDIYVRALQNGGQLMTTDLDRMAEVIDEMIERSDPPEPIKSHLKQAAEQNAVDTKAVAIRNNWVQAPLPKTLRDAGK